MTTAKPTRINTVVLDAQRLHPHPHHIPYAHPAQCRHSLRFHGVSTQPDAAQQRKRRQSRRLLQVSYPVVGQVHVLEGEQLLEATRSLDEVAPQLEGPEVPQDRVNVLDRAACLYVHGVYVRLPPIVGGRGSEGGARGDYARSSPVCASRVGTRWTENKMNRTVHRDSVPMAAKPVAVCTEGFT